MLNEHLTHVKNLVVAIACHQPTIPNQLTIVNDAYLVFFFFGSLYE